jgi:hypothetical protein
LRFFTRAGVRGLTVRLLRRRGTARFSPGGLAFLRRQLFGYGSCALSPPLNGSQSFGPPHFGQGGNDWTDETSIVSPQFVQRYVPAETSLPIGAGLAIFSSLLPAPAAEEEAEDEDDENDHDDDPENSCA